jgi:hypothetical protein
MKKEKDLMSYSKLDFIKNMGTAHNRTVYAAGAVAPLAFVRLGQSLRSFPRLTPAHFASPGHRFAVPLFGPAKRYIQPERYAPFFLNFLEKYLKIVDIVCKKTI